MPIKEAYDGLRCSTCAWRAPTKMIFKTAALLGGIPVPDMRVLVKEARFDCPQCGQPLVLRFER